MKENSCAHCGSMFPKEFKVCGQCGNPVEVEQKIVKPDLPYIGDLEKLLVNVTNSLEKESNLRLQIVSRKSKIKSLMSINSDQSGNVNLEVNKQKIKLKETTFRLIIQQEINELFEQLQDDLVALEEFNKKFE